MGTQLSEISVRLDHTASGGDRRPPCFHRGT